MFWFLFLMCGAYSTNIEHLTPQSSMQTRVMVRGMFDTGNNFMNKILLSNNLPYKIVDADYHKPYQWKHTPPQDLNSVSTSPNVLNVIMIRHPLAWITGIHKSPYDLSCKKDDTTCRLQYNGKLKTWPHIINVWNDYYNHFQKIRGNWMIVRYEDLLQDAEKEYKRIIQNLEIIQKRDRRRLFNIPVRPAKNHGRPRTFKDAKIFNMQQNWRSKFSQTQIQDYCHLLDDDLMKTFHYSC